MEYNRILFEDGTQLLQEVHGGVVIRYCDSDGMTVSPPQLGNYVIATNVAVSFVADEPAPPVVKQPVPESISAVQAKIVLSKAGLFESINSALLARPAGDVVRLAWEESGDFMRDSPTMAAVAGSFGLTSDQIDDLFRAGALIKV